MMDEPRDGVSKTGDNVADIFAELIHKLRGELLAEMPPAEIVLSAGCSGGWYFQWFDERYPHEIKRHIGFDIEPAPKELPANVEYHEHSFCDMSLIPDASVDLIFAGQAIEHVTTAESFAFYQHASRVLKESGWLVMDSPNFAITRKWPYVNPDHIIEYRTEQMEAILGAAGFKVASCKGILLCKQNEKILDDPYEYEGIDVRRIREAKTRAADSFIWWMEARREGKFNAKRLLKVLDKTNRQYEREFGTTAVPGADAPPQQSVGGPGPIGRLSRYPRGLARRVVPRPLRKAARVGFKRVTGLYYRDQMAVLSDINARVSHLLSVTSGLETRLSTQDEMMSLTIRRLRNLEQGLDGLGEAVRDASAEAAQGDADLRRRMRLLVPAASSMSLFWDTRSEESDEQELVMSRAVSDFYLQFQNKHRGSEELIRERQLGRLPYFKSCRRVLDIGCGRGEFLELLRADGIAAEGIDLSETAIESCVRKGLTASRAEAGAFLKANEAGTFDGMHMSHVLEHVSFVQAVDLLEACTEHLPDGGVLIAETPNPHSPEALQAFFLDPTHVRPLFPEALVILLESLGLTEVTAHFLNPIQSQGNGIEPALTDFADYLVVGVKAARVQLPINGEQQRSNPRSGSTIT